ncbi:hypothetical protein BB558_001277 [Smittium angustum]|uniref:Sterol 24-C-methyltransferase n=1 Tax=Smittium angustum TaxID=133377 RepID=A0A2U1JBU9_SMIAN|nr:hypothetical protein BB558_001277 [Smittium angustum]
MPRDAKEEYLEPTTENTNLLHGNSANIDGSSGHLFKSLKSKDTALQEESYKTYSKLWDSKQDQSKRIGMYKTMTNTFYNLVTDFYEYGWGGSFHFARRCKNESFDQSGPARECVRFTGAHVTGLNNNDYQIQRATKYAIKTGQQNNSEFVKGDFLDIPFPENTFDSVYAIEATCHAPEPYLVYKEIFKVLKPGGYAAIYEWCTMDGYNPEDPEQKRIITRIEYGNSLPKLYSTKECIEAFKKAGFEIISGEDLSPLGVSGDLPWYTDLFQVNFDFSSSRAFARSKFGRNLAKVALKVLSTFRIIPKSCVGVNEMLLEGAYGCTEGAVHNVFTPMFLIVARKPL